jgi:hypothetical protein
MLMWRVLVLALCACVLTPAGARAGTYDVHSCRLPDGSRAPARGWTAFTTFAYAFNLPATVDLCDGEEGGMVVNSGYQEHPIGAMAGWRFEAPADTAITGVSIQRWVDARYEGVFKTRFSYMAGFDAWPPDFATDQLAEACIPEPLNTHCYAGSRSWSAVPVQPFTWSGIERARVVLGLQCQGTKPCQNWQAAVTESILVIQSARMTITDERAPRFDSALAVAPGQVGFSVSDAGGGVAELVLLLDGNVIARERGADVQASCKAPYVDPVPCPTSRDVSLALGTLDVLDGAHELQARAVDAAGNVTLSRTTSVTTRAGRIVPDAATGPPAVTPAAVPNGVGASGAARLVATFKANGRNRVDLAYGRRATLVGRLSNADGGPIVGAQVQLLERPLMNGAPFAVRPAVTTGADGRFLVAVGPGASRELRFEYRSVLGDAAPTTTATTTLRVAAGATLGISPRVVRPRGRIRISGRLKGSPLPRSGKVVDLQAHERGRWRTFDTVRAARSGGRFSSTYRFLRAAKGASFEIRARVRRDDSYPYHLGYSPSVRVRIG